MRKRLVRNILFVLCLLSLCLGAAACTNYDDVKVLDAEYSDDIKGTEDTTINNDTTDNSEQITVYLSIDYPDEAKISDVDDYPLTVSKDATVIDALETYRDAENTIVSIETGSGYSYVTNIGGLSEGDLGKEWGWVFEVNDQIVMESADVCKLEAKDEIQWEYVNYNELSF